jgi:UDP-N-acetylglucosamine 2-epimerase (non-hydrolysing)
MIRSAVCPEAGLVNGERLILVTAHRRESFGAGLEGLCGAVRRLALERADLRFVYVLHPHPAACEPALRMLGNVPRVTLIPPLSYREFVGLMQRAELILTDSGGIQEEAPWLGKPVLVAREHTERPEAVDAGVARIVGHDPEVVAGAVLRVLDDPRVASAMARHARPFGEPGAAARISDDLARRCEAGGASW